MVINQARNQHWGAREPSSKSEEQIQRFMIFPSISFPAKESVLDTKEEFKKKSNVSFSSPELWRGL